MMWDFIRTQMVGSSHQRANKPLEDAEGTFTDQFPKQGLVQCVALADGAGSATHGGLGAKIAVHAVLQAARTDLKRLEPANLNGERLKLWFERAHAAIVAAAWEADTTTREFATTLLLGVLLPDRMLVAQIGDGAVVTKHAETWQAVIWPIHGDNPNTTVFLTSADWRIHWRTATLERLPSKIAFFTDGLERLALHYATKSAHDPFLDPLFAPLEGKKGHSLSRHRHNILKWLKSDAVTSQTDDDISLTLAVPHRKRGLF